MPEAILLADHENLGAKGTVVDVSKGYLRNYLIPRKLAEPATKGAVEAAKRRAVAAERSTQGEPPGRGRGGSAGHRGELPRPGAVLLRALVARDPLGGDHLGDDEQADEQGGES